VKVALAKGRGNYVCRRRLELAHGEPAGFWPDPDRAAQVARILDWAEESDDGSLADLPYIQGLSADIVREMFKRAGIDYSLTLRFPWDRIYQQALSKPNHGLFSTSMSEVRKPLFKWVGPIAQYQSVLVGRKGSHPQLNNLQQAKAYRIGAYQSAAVSQYLERLGFTPHNALRDQENIRKLQRGHIDLWATSDPVWRFYAREQGVDDLETLLSFETSQLYLALNKDTPDEVVERLQNALEQMRGEGYGSCAKNPELC
jgi:polar amino acid transport system substrate-binding protein